jgi:hypothetical protein
MQDPAGFHFQASSDYVMKGSCYGIKPSLTFTLPGEEFRPYARIGAMLSFSKLQEQLNMNVQTDNPGYLPFGGMEYTLEYKTRLTTGISACIGLEYMILSRLWLFAEAEANFVNYSPKTATYTKYVVSREDITASLTTHEREISFVESYDDADNLSASEPTKMLPVSFSFSSIGINVGLKYTLFD